LQQIDRAEQIAALFHAAYERLAPEHGYQTRQESARDWHEVPANNRSLMVAVAAHLIEAGVIRPGPAVADPVVHEPDDPGF
jgi:hypothetical protein